MPGYNYRIKRGVFRGRNTDKYQNFHSIEKRYLARKRAHTILRFVIILIALVVLIGVLIFTANADQKQTPTKQMDYRELRFKNVPDEI